MTLFSILKFLITPHTRFIFLWSPFLEPKKKIDPPICPPPTPTRVFMNTPLSRGEYRLLLLGRAEPSNPPSRGNLSIFEEKQAASASSLYF